VWEPERLPAVRPAGALSVTLASFSAQPRPWGDEPSATHADVAASFRVSGPGQPEGAWEPAALSLRDATGNRYEVLNYHEQPGEGAGSATGAHRPPCRPGFQQFWGGVGGLVSGETLRMRALLVRNRTARFTPEETWTLRDLPLNTPRRGWMPPSAVASRGGVTLESYGVTLFRAQRRQDYAGVLQLKVRRTGEERVTVLRAVDDRGRPVAAAGHVEAGYWPIRLRLAPDAKRVTVTLVVQKPIVVEYLVRPQAAGPRAQ
jgi:hypothetical protein